MIPVRKPGRPLSTCPCPPGRPCACGGVRVAIPKKQKCACPGDAAKGTDQREKEKSAAEAPKSPPKPSSYRVTKSNGNSRANGRKPSIDPTVLDRIDPNSINLITTPLSTPTTNGMTLAGSPALAPNGQVDPTAFGSGYVVLPPGPNGAYAVPQQQPSYSTSVPYNNMGFHYASSPQLQHNIKVEEGYYPNGGFSTMMPPPALPNGAQAPPLPIKTSPTASPKLNGASSGGGSCCGTSAEPGPPTSNGAQVPQMYTQAYVPRPSTANSCCALKKESPPPASDVQTSQQTYVKTYSPQLSAVNGSCCGGRAPTPPSASGQVQQPQENSCCANKTQSSVSAANQSVAQQQQHQQQQQQQQRQQQQQQQQQVFEQSYMTQFQYPTIFRYPGDYGSWQHPIDPFIWQQVMSQTATMPMGPTPMSPTTAAAQTQADTVDMGVSHQCNCGEGCQCVGCLAHPFNQQMFQYVNNAYSGSNTNSPGADQTQAAAAGGDSPKEAATPAVSEGSPPREEQSLSSLDYFFVNLPLSGICGGSLESCPCGDACSCPGCLVHGIPLNP
jgi:hypothetical protein